MCLPVEVSTLGMTIGDVDLPEVIWRTVHGLSVVLLMTGTLWGVHCHWTRKSKHFWSASAPPLANDRHSQSCAILCMEDVSVVLGVEGEGEIPVSHKFVLST